MDLKLYDDKLMCLVYYLSPLPPPKKISLYTLVPLMCDDIKKLAPFVLSMLWILVADWSMPWSRDTFLIKLRLYYIPCDMEWIRLMKQFYSISSHFLLTKNQKKKKTAAQDFCTKPSALHQIFTPPHQRRHILWSMVHEYQME